MKNLLAYVESVREMLNEVDIPYDGTAYVVVNNRLRRPWGVCKRMTKPNGKMGFIIEINKCLVDERNSDKGLIETLLHEYIHTCKDCFDHGETWKYYVDIVNKRFGLNVRERDTFEGKGISKEYIEEKNKNCWAVKCTGCGYVWYKDRISNFVKYPERYMHKGCSGKNGKLIRIQNKPGCVILKAI